MRSMFALKKKEIKIVYLYRSTAQTLLELFSARLLYFQSYFLTYSSLYKITVMWYLIGFKWETNQISGDSTFGSIIQKTL